MAASSLIPGVPAGEPDMAALPRRVDRAKGAELLTQYFFPTNARGLETWSIPWILVRGRAVCETADLFAYAQALVDAAPMLAKHPKAKPPDSHGMPRLGRGPRHLAAAGTKAEAAA
jgi:hypothetical protein